MSDENSDQFDEAGTSGNRWEPDATAAQPVAPPVAPPVAQPVAQPVAEPAAVVPSRRPAWLTRTRTAVAGGAAAVLLAGGLGGFAVGRASAGTDDGPGSQRNGIPTGFDRDGDGQGEGFQGGAGGGPMTGQPPNGQVPVMPGQDDGQDNDSGTDSTDT